MTSTEHRPSGIAADGSRLYSEQASSVFTTSWQAGGSAPQKSEPAPASAAEPSTPITNPEEESPMATKKPAAPKTRRKPMPLILQLLKDGPRPRKEIGEVLQLASSVLHNNLAKAKAQKLVKIDADGSYAITEKGLAEITEGAETPAAEPAPRRRAARKSGAHRRKRTASTPPESDVDTSPPQEGTSTFRCAVMSDGSFFLSKDDASIELDANEHRQMLAYLERMAVEEDAA